ncbi:3136_t:CDS:2 [Acaulospora morrowiae]|uniref:3136_t:CDS:1 n=1 Tax=Acaulospora morrowiae TaxID=94023 RepID=A0A9N9FXZ1_9GLOM|nr:3136_t:CDS:2 [Acaulospora morrowiae]
MTRLAKWVRKNLKGNVKETLDETIDHLIALKPPLKSKCNKAEALKASLRGQMKQYEAMRKEYQELDKWLNDDTPPEEEGEELLQKVNQYLKKARALRYKKPLKKTQIKKSIKTKKEQVASTKDKKAEEKPNQSKLNVRKGDECAYNTMRDAKKKLSCEIMKQSEKRKREDSDVKPQKGKKHLSDKELGELMDFTQEMIGKFASDNDEHNLEIHYSSKG